MSGRYRLNDIFGISDFRIADFKFWSWDETVGMILSSKNLNSEICNYASLWIRDAHGLNLWCHCLPLVGCL